MSKRSYLTKTELRYACKMNEEVYYLISREILFGLREEQFLAIASYLSFSVHFRQLRRYH